MRLLETCLYRFVLLICMCCTGYMIYLQLEYYLNNEDMASISYRIFNDEEKDEYPSFSICFKGIRGEIFNKSHDVFNSNIVTREHYYGYLTGYKKDNNSQIIEFDDVALDILKGCLMYAQETIVPLERRLLDLLATYQSPKELCVSKNIVHRKHIKQQFDYVKLNSSKLYEEHLWVEVFVHKKGQLIRGKATEGYRTVIDGKTLKNGVTRIIDVGQVDVLQKRADGRIPCDQDMQDEDEYRIKQIIKNVGCIPTFWSQLAGSVGLNQTNPICKTATEYSKVENEIQNIMVNITTLDITHKLHCTMMMASVTTRDGTDDVENGTLLLMFWYHGTSYREIMNTQAYTGEMLLAQIGGFVGMQNHF